MRYVARDGIWPHRWLCLRPCDRGWLNSHLLTRHDNFCQGGRCELGITGQRSPGPVLAACTPVVKVDRRIRWHYTTTILRLRIGARLTRYRNFKFHNFARTISRHADGISRYSVPPSAGPLLPLLYSKLLYN